MLPVDPPEKYEVDVFKGGLHENIGGEMSNIGNEGAGSKQQNGKFKIFRFNNSMGSKKSFYKILIT